MPRQLAVERFTPVVDERGSLLPIELGDVPFTVRRSFIVTGPVGGATRGEHVVPCAQLLCLVAGSADVRVGEGSDSLGDAALLREAGDHVLLAPGEYVSYRLADEHSTVIVLAEQPYQRSGRA